MVSMCRRAFITYSSDSGLIYDSRNLFEGLEHCGRTVDWRTVDCEKGDRADECFCISNRASFCFSISRARFTMAKQWFWLGLHGFVYGRKRTDFRKRVDLRLKTVLHKMTTPRGQMLCLPSRGFEKTWDRGRSVVSERVSE